MRDFVVRSANLLRWRIGIPSYNHHPIRTGRETTWSDDGQSWHPMPGNFRIVSLWSGGFMAPDDNVFEEVRAWIASGLSQPLGHELFREARTIQNENPRSSLLIGMAAAEIGVKTFIGTLIPDAEWLAMNAPTPPLVTILREYLPTLPVKRRFGNPPIEPFVPKAMLEVLKKGVTLRNQATHAGHGIDPETLREVLETVHDLLYLLDLYSGCEWAAERINYHIEALRVEITERTTK